MAEINEKVNQQEWLHKRKPKRKYRLSKKGRQTKV